MRKSILTFELLLVTTCTITIMLTVENLWANGLDIHYKETKNEYSVNNQFEDDIPAYSTCTWQGTVSVYWNNPSNWSTGVVPGSTVDVTIPSGVKQPEINSTAECHNIIIEINATLKIIGSNTLKIYGNWINNGTFTPNLSTVIFDGADQVIGTGPFTNLTIGGSGNKTIGVVQVTGILSIEGTAVVSNTINYTNTTILQYNCTEARTIGNEWLSASSSLETFGGVIIKNTGVISLPSYKLIKNTSLSIHEGATLNLGIFNLTVPRNLNLQCGGNLAGSFIKGSGKLILQGDLIVSNSGKGMQPAVIECPIDMRPYNIDVADGNPNSSNPTDLWVSDLNVAGSIKKTGIGTISIKGATSINSILTIDNGSFIIQPSGSVTCGRIYNNIGNNGLTLLSDANGIGSLIVNYQDIDKNIAVVKRYITPGAWHLISAPVIGQTIGDFLSTNTSIPTPIGATDPRAMRAYDPSGNQWGEFYNSTETNPLTVGKGYCMRVKTNSSHEVVFTGTLQAGDQTINGLSAGNWNCIGNPYTSAIGVTSTATSTANFLNVNAITNGNIDPAYGIYIWDNLDINNGQTGKYTAISNVSNIMNLHYLQQGQGFMVKMASGKTSANFTKAMQVHQGSVSLKSTDDIWPTINLVATADSINSSTIIAFHDGMTNGLDVTYDAGLLRSGGSLELYTRLVDDYGIPFAIQALPSDQYHSLIIPVGVDYTKGGQVNFSAKGMYLPSSCRPILEDRLTGIVTDLSNQTYTADLAANTAGTGRFFLHTSYATTAGNINYKYILNAYFINSNQLKIQGISTKNATITLTDALGRQIIIKKIHEENINIINIPPIKPGVYLLSIKNSNLSQTLKLMYCY